MRLKDTKEVVDMIKRIEQGGGNVDIATEINESSTNEQAAGAKAVFDFAASKPTYPAKGDTTVILRDGYTITIDCAKFKDIALDKFGETFTSLTVDTDFGIKIGRLPYGSEYFSQIFGITSNSGYTKCNWEIAATEEGYGSVDCAGTTLFTDVLDDIGTVSAVTSDINESEGCIEIDVGYMALMSGDDVFLGRVLSQEEVSEFLTITKPE